MPFLALFGLGKCWLRRQCHVDFDEKFWVSRNGRRIADLWKTCWMERLQACGAWAFWLFKQLSSCLSSRQIFWICSVPNLEPACKYLRVYTSVATPLEKYLNRCWSNFEHVLCLLGSLWLPVFCFERIYICFFKFFCIGIIKGRGYLWKCDILQVKSCIYVTYKVADKCCRSVGQALDYCGWNIGTVVVPRLIPCRSTSLEAVIHSLSQ